MIPGRGILNRVLNKAGGVIDSALDGGIWNGVKRGAKAANTAAMNGAAPVRNAARSSWVGRTFFRDVDPNVGNAYLGMKMKRGWGAAAFVGMGVTGGVLGAVDKGAAFQGSGVEAQPNIQYMGNIPGLDYDASPNGDLQGNRGLGASGSLVFGLNAGRKGGRG